MLVVELAPEDTRDVQSIGVRVDESRESRECGVHDLEHSVPVSCWLPYISGDLLAVCADGQHVVHCFCPVYPRCFDGLG